MRLIDADAFYELIDGGDDIDFNETPETKRELLRMIVEAPTIKAEPIKYGKWMKDGNTLRCSNCGYAPISKIFFQGEKIWEISLIDKYHWCPYCGTKMNGEEAK